MSLVSRMYSCCQQAKPLAAIRQDCVAALQDGAGAKCSTLRAMGASPAGKKNTVRDVLRRLCKDINVPMSSCPIIVPQSNALTGLVKDKTAGIVPAHGLLAALYAFDAAHSIFFQFMGRPSDWTAFWKASENETWHVEHELRPLLLSNPELCIPYPKPH